MCRLLCVCFSPPSCGAATHHRGVVDPVWLQAPETHEVLVATDEHQGWAGRSWQRPQERHDVPRHGQRGRTIQREVNSWRTIASETAAPLRRGPCRKLAAGLGPAARPGTATSTSTPLSSMRWNYRAHLSSKFDVLPMLEHERVADDELDGGHPSMSSMVPDATASTTKHGGPLETHHDDQAPPSTLRRRVVSDPGPTIPAAGGTVEARDHKLKFRSNAAF